MWVLRLQLRALYFALVLRRNLLLLDVVESMRSVRSKTTSDFEICICDPYKPIPDHSNASSVLLLCLERQFMRSSITL